MNNSSDSSNSNDNNLNANLTQNDVLDEANQLKDTETDMMFQMFANSEKLVSEDKLQEFDKNLETIRETNENNSEELSDLIDSDRDQNNQSFNNNFTDDYTENNNNNYTDYQQTDNYEQNNNQSYNYTEDNKNYNSENNNNYENNKTESKEESMLKKLDMLRKLGELSQYGVKLSQNYNMNSDFETMKYEYELHKNIRAKRNAVNWMSSMMMNCVYGLEMANDKYNPFDLKLKGWSEQMNAESENYYDVFGELYEKYSQPGKSIAPEIKLMLMVSGSAIKFHLANTLMGSMPNLQEKFKSDPVLAQKLREQAARDKIASQTKNQNDSFNRNMQKQHDIATQKAMDIEMLKEKTRISKNATTAK